MVGLYVVRGCDARKGRETEGRIGLRVEDKILPHEPGGAYGVPAYSAAPGSEQGLAGGSKTPSKGKRRNTRALQTLRDCRRARTNAVTSIGAT